MPRRPPREFGFRLASGSRLQGTARPPPRALGLLPLRDRLTPRGDAGAVDFSKKPQLEGRRRIRLHRTDRAARWRGDGPQRLRAVHRFGVGGILFSLRRLITSVGFKVEVFPSARAFLGARRPDAPGCLVLDVRLPRLSGLALQRELAETDAEMPIIFLTGHGDMPMRSGA